MVVNHRRGADKADKLDNEETLARLSRKEGIPEPLQIGWVDAASPGLEFPVKGGGVGRARKTGLDLALTRLSFQSAPPCLFLSMPTRLSAPITCPPS